MYPVRSTCHVQRPLPPPMREALRARVTIGELSNALRAEWGTFDAQRR